MNREFNKNSQLKVMYLELLLIFYNTRNFMIMLSTLHYLSKIKVEPESFSDGLMISTIILLKFTPKDLWLENGIMEIIS